MVDEILINSHVQLLQAMPQHLRPGMTLGLTALEAPLDGDPAGRLVQGRRCIGQDGGLLKAMSALSVGLDYAYR